MKKLFLAAIFLFAFKHFAFSDAGADFANIPSSSYTEVATGSAILFSSAVIQFVGITISSPSPGSYVAVFRSTSATFTPDISTQAFISTDYFSFNQSPQFIPLFDMRNTSYTYINKAGTAKLIYWVRCPSMNRFGGGFCPGLTFRGQ